jgi:HlyD family secretion protein
MKKIQPKKLIIAAIVLVLAIGAIRYGWQAMHPQGPGAGFASGNGRIEATEVDVATKLGGRIDAILVKEGDFVKAGQVLARMDIQVLQAQREEAAAQRRQAVNSVAAAEAQVAMRRSDKAAGEAAVAQRESELDAARRKLARSETLTREGAASEQELDDDRARFASAQAAVAAARAQAASLQAAITAAEAQVVGAKSAVEAATATIARIEADITDSQLIAPRDGRVQYQVAQAGEVLGAGGKVLNMVDLSDVYMTFFLPSTEAGRLAIGSEARIVLDAAPQFVIPATISFVSSTAQFTPKSVETESERQKLMFRIRAKIAPELLQKNLTQVKTGLPGVTWVKTAPDAAWPPELTPKLETK